MKKIYTILTSIIIFILIIHMIYMALSVMNVITPNEDFAQNLGYTLMFAAILHGIYGLVKWARTWLHQRKLDVMIKAKHEKRVTMCKAARRTMLQRILGLFSLFIIIPHESIKVMSAQAVWLIADICFMVALIIHAGIGLPKWIVSLGLKSENKMKR
jgi:hypothetical protein